MTWTPAAACSLFPQAGTGSSWWRPRAHLFAPRRGTLPTSVRQAERDILARVAAAADGYDDVLLAIDRIRHRIAALRSRHEHGADLSSGRLVVGPQHRAARMLRRGGRRRVAHDHHRLGDDQADAGGLRLAGPADPGTLE